MATGAADATLVSAAFKMGQAAVPHDTSKIFQAQYQALGEMQANTAAAFGSVVETGLGVAQKIKHSDDFYESLKQAEDDLANTYLSTNSTKWDEDQRNGKGVDEDTKAAAQAELEDIKSQIETLENMPGTRTTAQQKALKDLKKDAIVWRDETNRLLADYRVHSANMVDDTWLEESFKDENGVTNVDHKFVYGQILDRSIPINSVGIYKERRNGQPGYVYDSSSNKASVLNNYLVNAQRGINGGPVEIEEGNKVWISHEELFGGAKLKDKEVMQLSVGHMIEGIGLATKADYASVTNANGDVIQSKNKKFLHEELPKNKIQRQIYETLTAKRSIGEDGQPGAVRDVRNGVKYMMNNPIHIGETSFLYSEESRDNPDYSELTYSGLGLIPSNVDGVTSGVDNNGIPGLQADELSQEDLDFIHAKMMDPRTPEEVEFAAQNVARHMTLHTIDQFNKKKREMMMTEDGEPIWKKQGFSNVGQYEKHLAERKNYGKTNTVDPTIEFDLITKDANGNDISTKKKPKRSELVNIDNQLSSLMEQSSFDTEDYVDVFGNRVGYFPGKGFAPVRVAKEGDVGEILDSKGNVTGTRPTRAGEITRKNPEYGYFKTPRDVFTHYSIPTTYNKKIRPQ